MSGFSDNSPGLIPFGNSGLNSDSSDGLFFWSLSHQPAAHQHTILSPIEDGRNGDGAKSNGATTPPPSSGTTGTTTSSSSLIINITWDASVQSAPSGFTAGVLAAVQYLESQFSDPITINIDVGYGEVDNTALGGGALGESRWYLNSYSYSQLASALTADATSSADASATASLPASSPVNGTFWATTAQAKALGLMSGSSIDGYVGFSSAYAFTYDNSAGVAGGTYDFNGVVLHEITEVMGRALLTGGAIDSIANSYMLYDLFHYSAPGVRDFSASTPGYFSVDGGQTSLGAFNTTSGGDAGDWASAVTNDTFDAFTNPGVTSAVSSNDLAALDAIGWNLSSVAPPPAPPPPSSPPPPPPPSSTPTGITESPVTASLATVQSSTGLLAHGSLVNIAQVGGTSGDTYGYSLGGTGSSVFSLSSSGNTAILTAGPAGVPGGAGGKLYGLSVTANDLTAGTSSPASALDVVVGSSGSDTINLATLVGSSATTTPTFIYGLAGADTINGTGTNASLWFVGGTGADVMTGGGGKDDYLYGAVSDSPNAFPDVITNFNASMDLIDLRGLNTALKYDGQLNPKGRLGAHSVGWQVSGGNTFVYVNASSSPGSVGSSDMRIELLGKIALSSGDILHN